MVFSAAELADEALLGPRILPIYPLTESLNQTGLRRIIKTIVDEYAPFLEDMFPPEFLSSRKMPGIVQAVRKHPLP